MGGYKSIHAKDPDSYKWAEPNPKAVSEKMIKEYQVRKDAAFLKKIKERQACKNEY